MIRAARPEADPAAEPRLSSGERMIRHRELAVAAPAALFVLLAPWWFGSVTPMAAAMLEAGFAAAFAAAVLLAPDLARIRKVAVPAAALLLLALLGWGQSLRWPGTVAGALSPEHRRLTLQSEAVAEGGSVPQGGRVALSLAPEVSRRIAAELAALALALVGGALAGSSRAGRKLIGGAVLAAGLAELLYSVPRWLAGASELFGVAIQSPGRLRGTFVNPNHFAEYLEIALAVSFAVGWWSLRRATRPARLEARIAWIAAPALVWCVLFAGLLFTGSRAGVLAAGAGTLAQVLLAAASLREAPRLRRLALAGAGAAVVAGGAVLVIVLGTRGAMGRLAATSAYEVTGGMRVDVYRAALGLWRRFPVFGTGLGTFFDAFPLVQPSGLPLSWRHAHNDPLELLVTTGVVGAALSVVGLAAVVVRLVRVLRRGVRTEDRAAALAALGGLAALGLHEAVDFGLTIPAISFTLVTLLGAAAAAPRSPRRSGRRPGPRAPSRGDREWPPPRARAGGSPG